MMLEKKTGREVQSVRAVLLIGASLLSLCATHAGAAEPDANATAAATATDGGDKDQTGAKKADTSDLEEVLVTGSRIKRANFDTIQPAETLGAQEILNRGYTNLGQALQELPAFSVPANSTIGSQGSYGAGQTFANLYDLGAQRTLALVNGHRFVSSATSSIFGAVAGSPVDMSSIPTALVDRVEVVAVGGAPIYGSDAIAGTVNIILKKNYEGAEVNVQGGIAQHGDAANGNASAVFGHNFADGRGNITVAAEVDKQNGLTTADRPNSSADGYFLGTALPHQSFTQQLYPNGRHYTVFTNTGMPLVDDGYAILRSKPSYAVTNAAGQALYFGPDGTLTPFKNGAPTGNALYQSGGDGFRIADYGNLLTRSDRQQVTAQGHYDITDHLHFNSELWYGRVRASNLADQPFYNYAGFGDAGSTNGNLVLSTDNPFLTAQDRATLKSALTQYGGDPSTFYMARANTDLSSGAFTTTSNLYRVVAGLNGDFDAGNRNFTWEVTGTWGQSQTTTEQREIVTQNLFNALNAVTDSSGNIVCAPGYTNATIATLSSTCAPLNIFGVNKASRAAINYITAIAKPTQNNIQDDIVADIGSSIFALPAGDVKYSLGYEYRREAVHFDPGTFYYGEPNGDGTRTQYGNSIPIDPVAGEYHTNEFFGELNVPVVAPAMDIPLINRLDGQAAARYIRNNQTGGFWSYTFGGSYQPVEDVTFRGNYTRSFRAPAITEAYSPTGQIYTTADDPCDSRYIKGGANPAQRAANCAAAGLPANFTSNIVDYTAMGTSSGNPNLKNEIADSWTAGLVARPRYVPNLTLSADYISIDISQEVSQLGATDLLDACYDNANMSGNAFCNTFTRDADGQVTFVKTGYYNAAIESFRAMQAEMSYLLNLSDVGLPSNSGSVNFSANYLLTFNHYYKVGTGDTQYVVGTSTDPRHNITINTTYQRGNFDFFWQTQWYGPARVSVNNPVSNYQYPDIDPFVMFNASTGYSFDDGLRVRLLVDNVFDTHEPFPYTGLSTTRYFSALLGRSFKLNVGLTF